MIRTRERLGLSMQYPTPDSLPTPLANSQVGFFSYQRGQTLSWIKWFTPSPTRSTRKGGSYTEPRENEHPTRSGCKCMWKLSVQAGEYSYRKAAGCKSADRDRLFTFFVPLLISCKMFPFRWGNVVKVIFIYYKRVHPLEEYIDEAPWLVATKKRWFLFIYYLLKL